MDNCCHRRNKDAEGGQRLSRICAVYKAQGRRGGDVRTRCLRSQNVAWERVCLQFLRQVSQLVMQYGLGWIGSGKETHCMDL